MFEAEIRMPPILLSADIVLKWEHLSLNRVYDNTSIQCPNSYCMY